MATSAVSRRGVRQVCVALTIAVMTLLVGAVVGRAPVAVASPTDVPPAIQSGVDNAARYGVTQYVAVIDRSNGQLVGSTANAGQQVASESVMKLFLAAYYLRAYNGQLPARMNNDLWFMILASDDATASRYWTESAIPTMSAVYGLTASSNDPSRPAYWGAARITAYDMATFLWRASQDPLVAGWLFGAMSNTADNGSDGYNQNFGFNAIPGAGSKQGWGCDSYWVGPCAIHSVGFTDKIVAAVLQTGSANTYNSMPGTASVTASSIATAAAYDPPRLHGRDNPEGDFNLTVADGTVYLDGWAFDGSDLLWNVPVLYTVNGTPTISTVASLPSPVLAPYGIPGAHRTFSAWPVPNTGSYRFCMFLQNTGAGSPQLVRCRDASIAPDPIRDDPRGSLSASVAYDGTITVTGYAYDPSNLYAATGVWISDNGRLAGAFAANAAAPSLAPYGIPGGHGISYRYAAPETGPHDVCLYVLNLGWGNSVWPACVRVNFPADHDRDDPHGDFAVVSTSGGGVTLGGWSFDKNNLYTVTTTMFTVDGVPTAYATANQPSAYLAQYGVPGTHGLYGFVPARPGSHSVCMFTFNIGYGSDQLNRCVQVTTS